VLLAITSGRKLLSESYGWVKDRFRYLSLTVLAASLFVVALLVWRLAASAPDGRLHVTFLDDGSADAILIETPSGGRILVNGGPSAAAVSDALGRRLSPFDHRLEWLIVASTDEAQVASLPRLIQRFPPKSVLWGGLEQASFSSAALVEQVEEEGIPLQPAEIDQVLDLGDGISLKVVSVSSRGSTMLLEWNTFRMLLPIGANLDALDSLEQGASVGPVGVLLLAQGGYAPLMPSQWLDSLSPQLVIISVGLADRDGLPSAETLELLEDYPVLRTDQNGWIEISTDGSRMWVSAERARRESVP
jgi:beta-lactamase superfamily II metal-dependent hydrolase